jgi:hypothetical protein
MPPEHDDYRERQLAALRRYVSDLDVRRQHDGDQLGPGEERRRTAWPRLLVILLLMTVSLAGGIAIGGNRDAAGPSRSSGFESATASSVAASPTASPECAEAVRRANASMSQHGAAQRHPLADHGLGRVGQVRRGPGRLPQGRRPLPAPHPLRPAGPHRGRALPFSQARQDMFQSATPKLPPGRLGEPLTSTTSPRRVRP